VPDELVPKDKLCRAAAADDRFLFCSWRTVRKQLATHHLAIIFAALARAAIPSVAHRNDLLEEIIA
jgi:hypothetical protein